MLWCLPAFSACECFLCSSRVIEIIVDKSQLQITFLTFCIKPFYLFPFSQESNKRFLHTGEGFFRLKLQNIFNICNIIF